MGFIESFNQMIPSKWLPHLETMQVTHMIQNAFGFIAKWVIYSIITTMTILCDLEARWQQKLFSIDFDVISVMNQQVSPDHRVSADDELWPWVPLVVGDVVVRLKPDPLLTFSQKTVIARLPLTVLHHCRDGENGRNVLLLKTPD